MMWKQPLFMKVNKKMRNCLEPDCAKLHGPYENVVIVNSNQKSITAGGFAWIFHITGKELNSKVFVKE